MNSTDCAPINLYIWDDRFLYASPSMRSGFTSRRTATILIATAQTSLEISLKDGTSVKSDAFLIAPDIERTLDATNACLISLNLDPQSFEYQVLKAQLGERPYVALSRCGFVAQMQKFQQVFKGAVTCGEAFRLFVDIVSTISSYQPSNISVDLRVLHVAHRLKAELPSTPPVQELADNVGLSTHRLTHLFTEQLGLSMRSYVLWAKMRRAAVLLGSDQSLTDVAYQVGFTDSAHLSRTFQQFFGLPPSFLGDKAKVKVHACET